MDMNKEKKLIKSVMIIYTVLLAVYSISFWVIPFSKKTDNITAYLFSCIAIILSYITTYQAFQSTDDLTEKIYGYPIFRIGCVYAGVQMLISIVIDFVSVLITIPFWMVFVVCIICLGAAVIGMIMTENARQTVVGVYQETDSKEHKIKSFQLDVSAYVAKCQTPREKTEMEKLAEKFRFSDPVSNSQSEELEAILQVEVERLENMLDQEEEIVLQQVQFVGNLLEDRNRRCKAGK